MLKGRTSNMYKREEKTKSFVYKNILTQMKNVRERNNALPEDSLKRNPKEKMNNRIISSTKPFFLLRIFLIKQF